MNRLAQRIVMALLLAAIPFAKAEAQRTCMSYWTAAYKCLQGCGPCGTGGGTVIEAPQPPSAEELEFRRALPRMIAVIDSMGGDFINRESWMADLPQTPAQFIVTADRLHAVLASRATAWGRQATAFRANIAQSEAEARAMTEMLPEVRARIARRRGNLADAQGWVDSLQSQIDTLQRLARSLDGRASQSRPRVAAAQRDVLAALAVLLPEAARQGIDLPRIREAPDQDRLPRPNDEIFAISRDTVLPASPAQRLPLDTSAPVVERDVPRLGGSLDARAAALEADARATRANFAARNALTQQSFAADAELKAAATQLSEARQTHDTLVEQLFGKRTLAERLRTKELEASDTFHSAEARFVVYAAQEWIWQNAKKQTLDAIKVEFKANDYVSRHTDYARSPFLDIKEADILRYYEERRFNIMNLPDGIENAVGLRKLHNSMMDLLSDGKTYALAATEFAAHGSETETLAFAAATQQGLDKDSREIVAANLGVISVPQPFADIMARMFVRTE